VVEGGLHTPVSRTAPAALTRRGAVVSARVVVALIDLAAIELSITLGLLVASGFSMAAILTGDDLPRLLLGGALLLAAYAAAGVIPGYGLASAERLRRRSVTTSVGFGLLMGWEALVVGNPRTALTLAVAGAVLLVIGPLAEAGAQLLLQRLNLWGKPVIVLGAREVGRSLVERLRLEWRLGMVPVGFLDEQPERLPPLIDEVPVLGPLSEAARFANIVDTAVVALPFFGNRRLAELVAGLPFPHIILAPELPDVQSLWVSGRDMGGVLALEMQKGLLLRRNRVLKRGIDVVAAAVGLAVTCPLLALAAMAVAIVDPGMVMFAQERHGVGGRTFQVLKLRSMYQDAEARLAHHLETDKAAAAEWRQFFKLRHDPRVLPVIGKWLRKSSIDELPQLWNVLRGEMSLVGPRPFPDYHLAAFDTRFRALRQSVRPGLTGLWQVSVRSNGDLATQRRLDTYYIRNWSIWIDLEILLRTLGVVMTGRGAS